VKTPSCENLLGAIWPPRSEMNRARAKIARRTNWCVTRAGSGVYTLWHFRLAGSCSLSVGGWAPSGAANPARPVLADGWADFFLVFDVGACTGNKVPGSCCS
jgi:hypothetical protein